MSLPSHPNDARSLAEALLAWYRPRRRAYPWRRSRDPYAILVSEVMLQQTQAARVVPAFERFLAAFPTVGSLAAASRADVVRAWDGLGHNRRAVALSRSSRVIVEELGGRVPADPQTLRSLPGVGPYTAAAVASIAHRVPVAAVDTNVARIVARVHLGCEAREASHDVIDSKAEAWLDRRDPAAWNQALMDLGREVCRPRPRCSECPLSHRCRFLAAGAEPRSAAPTQSRFEGSSRQVRGSIVRALRERSRTIGGLARETGFDRGRIRDAIRHLDREGILVAGPAALEGRPAGRVRLAG